ncbi:MAG: tRNA1(Val) (adenine(37)-N6)-methyltransferase [Nitrospirae bacterium]|nr:tRNA1(Val) (adenine(37)-N6)-methyltransferase [Nitrospirota bacterium]
MPMLTLDTIRDIQIYQNKNGYRFSVDALLLFSFINLPRVKKIADLGAGSGIIGILLAKKYPHAEVTLIELQRSLARLAEKNVVLNKLKERVKVIRADLKELSKTRLFTHLPILPFTDSDLVVSNPPFRKVKTGRLSIGDEKAIARHEIKLSIKDLVKAGSTLLKHHGRLCIIHLPERLAEIMDAMKENNLEPKRLRFIHSSVSTEAKMVLIEAVKGGRPGLKTERPLFIYNEDGSYTDEMRDIYNE